MLSGSAYKRMAMSQFGVELRFKQYVNPTTAIEHKCPNCGKPYMSSPEKVLAATVPYCPDCTQQYRLEQHRRQDELSFVEQLSELAPSLTCVEYNGNSKLGVFRCRVCNTEMRKLPRAALSGQVKCTKCDEQPTKGLVPSKTQAIKWLLKRVKPSEIKTLARGEVPVVRYKVKGRQYNYWPDFLVGNVLVEARSSKMFWRHLKLSVEKAKACVRAGYRFKLLISTPGGNIRCLPEDWYTRSRTELEAIVATKAPVLRILSIDPGTTNAAWAVSEYNKKAGRYELLASGKLLATVTDLTTNIAQQIQDFTNEIQNLVDVYQVNCLAMERYQARGMKGTTIEAVNIMLGVGITQCMRNSQIVLFRVIPASQWKNAWNRISVLEDYYAKAPCVIHQADAIGIGIYCLADWLGFKMDVIMGPKVLPKLLAQIKRTDTMTLTIPVSTDQATKSKTKRKGGRS